MRARPVVACQVRAITSDPVSRVVSSPREPLGDAYQADPAVQYLAQVHCGVTGGDGVADERSEEEGAEFVHQWADDLGAGGDGEFGVLGPEAAEDGVGDAGGDPAAERLVGRRRRAVGGDDAQLRVA